MVGQRLSSTGETHRFGLLGQVRERSDEHVHENLKIVRVKVL